MSNNDTNVLNQKTNSEKIGNDVMTPTLENTSSNSIPVDVVQSLVQYFVTTITECSQMIVDKNAHASEKLSNMFTFVNFEGKTIELMLENKYYMDQRGKKTYAQIKESAMASTLNSIGKLSDTTNLKLYEELELAKNKIAELETAMANAKQCEEKLQQENNVLREKNIEFDNEADIAAKSLKEYIRLTEWYEDMLAEVPKIKKKNSGLIRVQSWENAMECYIYEHPKPEIAKFIFYGK